jgi:aldehyde:ferredoxin oxidoreductase
MTPSYCGNILHVNLTTGEIKYEHPQDDFYRKYIGGSAMGVYYILQETPPHTNALSPENTLTFFVSPTTGLAISGQSRINVNARSPLTDAIGDSQAGGFFPAGLKFAGFDGLVIKGASIKPVYLLLENGKAEIKDANHLWGKLTGEAEAILKKEIGDEKIEVAQIGPAGEELVRFAAIMNMHNRANGRTGMGAVMGSKKLKAIVVRGKSKVEPVDRATLLKMNKDGVAGMETIADMKGIAKNGTADVVGYQNSIGSLPTRSYNEGQFEGFESLSGDKMTETILKRRDTCFGCVVHCKRVVETEYKGEKVDPTYGGPEYETIGTFGSFCGINNLSAVALAHQICDAWGMDTISGGATISFAMECYSKGLITKEQTDGIELTYGDADAMLAMLKNIAARKGFGRLLGEGSARAAKVIGKGSEKLLVTCKGQELPAHMPQSKKSMAVIYAVNPFGADHQSAEMDPMYEEGGAQIYFDRLAKIGLNQVQKPSSMNNEKVRFAYLTEVFYSALDTFTLCQFVWGPSWQMYGPDETVALIKAATGWDFSVEEFMQVGERRLNLMRAFNAREGFERKDDTLPVKFAKPLQGTGPSAGVAIDFKELEHYKDTYYQLAGWDGMTGNPTANKLAGLGLDWINV